MSQLERLSVLLRDAGFEFEVSGYESTYTVSVDLPIEDAELPEELRPFAWTHDEVDRAIWKGNTNKKTYVGAEFELALREYASDVMRRDPESLALDASWDFSRTDLTMADLEAYQAQRKAIWERIVTRPEIVAWEVQLDTLF